MENNIKNEEIKETKAPEEVAKKSLPWWVFAAIGGAVVVIVAVVLILTLGGCKGHVDADDDFKCDLCGKTYDDGDEIAPIQTADVTLTVKDSDGNLMSGVKLVITGATGTYTVVSGSDGTVKQQLPLGKYSVTYDYATIPAGFMPDTTAFTVAEGAYAVEIIIIDNNPNGTAARPFRINDDETELSVAAGEEIFYAGHGASVRTLVIKSEGLEVKYNGEVYTAVDGEIKIVLAGSIDEETRFSVKNVSANDIQTKIEIIFPLGSRENPIELTESEKTVSLAPEQITHLEWIATSDGVLIVTASTIDSNVTVSKIMENDVSISSAAYAREGAGDTVIPGYAYLAIKAGETVIFAVGNESEEQNDVSFSFTTCAATEANPLPLSGSIDLSFAPGQSISFCVAEGKTLTIQNEDNLTVTHAGETYDIATDGFIYLELESGAIFTVTNADTMANGITIEIED